MAKAKLKGKQWYEIMSPKMFGSKQIGETPAKDDEDIMGRTIEIGVPDITENSQKYYLKLTLQVDEILDGKAHTRFQEIETLRDYISRMVQRRIRRIDSVDKVRTKDGVLVRIKTIGISIRRINSSLKSSVRGAMSKVAKDYVSKRDLDQVVQGVIENKPQGAIRNAASKQYPLRGVEVRKIEVLEYPEDRDKE